MLTLLPYAALAPASHALAQQIPAQQGRAPDADLAQQLSNPVANLISVPLQNNLDYGGGQGDALRYTLNIQPVIPLTLNADWNLITRTILPVQHTERVARDHATGLGDVTQSFFLSPSSPSSGGVTWGAGPVFLYPTATEASLGQRQWAAGPTGVALHQQGGWLYGLLANHLWGLGGTPDGREDVNATFLQPFLSYTWPSQTGLVLNSESTYDWSRGEWTVPVNVMATQLVRIGGQALQLGLGYRKYLAAPESAADWGLRFNVTFVFPR